MRPDSGPDHWRQLALLLRCSPPSAASLLRCPCPLFPDSGEMIAGLAELAAFNDLGPLLARHLFSCLALSGARDNREVAAKLAANLHGRYPDLAARCPAEWKWLAVPVPACRGPAVEIVWFLIGRDPDGPDGVRPLLSPFPDKSTDESISIALAAAGATGSFLFFSLQESSDIPVTGPSLGLAFGAAFSRLAAGDHWPADSFATGALEPDGRVGPVEQVREKFTGVMDRCRLFLYPLANPDDLPAKQAVPCQTLADALFALDMVAGGGRAGSVDLYRACLNSPHVLLRHYQELPDPFFAQPGAGEQLDRIRSDPSSFLEEMTDALRKIPAEASGRAELLTGLLDPEHLGGIVERNDELLPVAMTWIIQRVSRANHSGDISGAAAWFGLAEKLRSRLGMERECFQYLNHRFVGERFNRFDFRPELFEEFADFIWFEEKRNEHAPRDSYALGAAYGTVAQNFGFCGPAYCEELIKYTDLADRAFGTRYRRESKRLSAYRVLALLDREEWERAGVELDGYLGLESPAGTDERLAVLGESLRQGTEDAPYEVAVLLRFLADTGWLPDVSCVELLLEPLAELTLRRHSHPWQLVGRNLGLLFMRMQRPDTARRLFRHGLEVCAAGEATMRAMGLLLLADLAEHGLDSSEDRRLAMELVAETRDPVRFNTRHFSALHDLEDGRAVLARVVRDRKKLFPFSYR